MSQIERDMFAPLQPTPPRPRTLHPTLAGRHRQGAVHRQGGGRRASLLHLTYISATSRVYRQKHSPGAKDAQAQTVEKGESATAVRSQHWVPARRMRCVYRQSPALEGKSAAASVVPHGHRPPSPHTRARRRSLSRRRCSSLSSSGKASRSTCRSDPAEISPRSRRDLAAISPRYQAPKPDDPREVSPLYLCCISTVSPLYLRRCRNR